MRFEDKAIHFQINTFSNFQIELFILLKTAIDQEE